ncbi:MAG: ABC transporter permease [Eubacteriales bacterium]|nr:ABC transporter permease [Eubacteriales bacterium]
MKKSKYMHLLALVPFLVVALLYELIPLLTIIIQSFRPDGGGSFTLENYKTVFSTLLYQSAIINSLKISLISAIFGIIIAFIGAKAANEGQGKLGSFFMAILNMVSNFAGIPLAFAFMILLGSTGVMMNFADKVGFDFIKSFDLYTSNGIAFVYVYFQIPLATLLLIPSFAGVRNEWKEACTILGGGPATFWTKVGIPVLMPSVLGTFSVLFANALAAYATVYALMMSNISLLPVQIAGCYVGEVTTREGLGGALSVVMMIIMVAMIGVTNLLSKRFERGQRK